MKAEWWEKIDLQALKEVRRNKPPSHAKESKFYTDPGRFIEFEAARKQKKKGKR